jgi:cytochrome c peroxidase
MATTLRTLVRSWPWLALAAVFRLASAAPPRPPLPPPPAPPPAVVVNAPAALTVGAVATTLAADGTTAIVATLKKADGALYTEREVLVNFSSSCAALGVAQLDTAVLTVNGIAAALYQPNGCTAGSDTVSASVGTGTAALRASVALVIGGVKALSPKATLGKALFFDKALSAAGNVSCASCHSPALAYRAANRFAVPLGGVSGAIVGFRTAPSAAYAALIPPFRFLPLTNKDGTANNGANGKLGAPRAGQMWDGRAATVFEQAKGPFTGPHEMANADSAAVLVKLLGRPYLASYSALFGPVSARSNADAVLANMAGAIGQYETEDAAFSAFSSKFDAAQKNLTALTPQEANGQLLFSTPTKGACLGCHSSNSNAQSAPGPQLFTDLSYRVLAVPRNWALPYNDDAKAPAALKALNLSNLLNGANLGAPGHQYYDLGVCGPFRTDSQTEPGLCGAFRVPSLRNMALKGSYFHNGVYSTLDQVVHFYLNRDSAAGAIYTKADGSADLAYNDLPQVYQANRESRPPFAPVRGGGPRLTASEVQDVIAFLCTLTDGYDPQHPGAYRLPLQCRNAIRP